MTLIKVKSRGTDNVTGRKNMFINGDMQVFQRVTSQAFAHDGTTSTYVLDRWRFSLGGTHEQLDGNVSQAVDHPFGANRKSLKWTTGTAESSYDADEYAYFTQKVEAQNLQHLNYSTSNAKTTTISFYVKSSITGTYAVGLYKPDNTARIFNKTYTINSANTWEKKTVTFVGDVSGTSINNDNGQGLWISWHLAAGSSYTGGGSTSGWVNYSNDKWADGQGTNAVMTTAGATWQMTQCQLEVGDSASDFEDRSFGEELTLCQRYFSQLGTTSDAVMMGLGVNFTANNAYFGGYYPVEMRATPTISVNDAANFRCHTQSGGGLTGLTAFATNPQTTNKQYLIYFTKSGAFGQGAGNLLFNNVSPTYGVIKFDAEL